MQNLETDTLNVLKKSFDWLDSDKDQQISIRDIETSCGISTDEAKSLFDSLSTKSESFISFQEFCEGVLSFPSLIDQFKSDQQRAERLSIDSSSPLTQICSLFNISSQSSEEDLIVQLSDNMQKISDFPRPKLLSVCECLFTSFLNLQEFCKTLQEQLTYFNLEHSLHQENLLKEKMRCEKNYEKLAEVNKNLEKLNKELEQQVVNAENEGKDDKMKVFQYKNDLKVLNSSIAELKLLVKNKDKQIVELEKALHVKNALAQIENSQKLGTIKEEIKKKDLSVLKVSKTPRGTAFKNFEAKDSDSAKDQVLKNLKLQFAKQESLCQQLEHDLDFYKSQNLILQEKVRLLSVRSEKASEVDEDEKSFQFDTLESLKDEVYYIDSNVFHSKHASLHKLRSLKDSSVQVEILLDRKKSRYSCFSFFS